MPLKLKTLEVDGKTFAEVKDGHPVYIDTDNGDKEVAFDAEHSVGKITALNKEAEGHRRAKEDAEKISKQFEGVDAEAARKALETVAALDSKELFDAGKVEEIKSAAVQAADAKYADVIAAKDKEIAEVTGQRDSFSGALDSEVLGGSFARSKYIEENMIVPTSAAQAMFRENFKIEEGKTVAYGPNGEKLFSRAKPGEPAGFEEALEMLVDMNPDRDRLLKGRQQQGSGAPGDAGNPGGPGTMTRAAYEQLDAASKQKTVADKVQIVD